MQHLLPFRLFAYILREALPFILLTLIVLTALIFAQQVARQSEILFQSNAAFYLTVKVLVFLLPGVLVITLPFSLLIGSLLALNRLTSDSEIIAARASGISLTTIAQPLLACGMSGIAICGYLTISVNPYIFSQAKLLKSQLILIALTAPLKPQTFDNHFPNHVIFLKDIDRFSGDWIGVFIVRKLPNGESSVLTAQRGRLRMTQSNPLALEVELQDGILVNYNERVPEKQNAIKFTQQAIKLSNDNPALASLIEKDRTTQELSLAQLVTKERSSENSLEKRQAKVEWHKRLSLPVACLVLVVLAVPLGTKSGRQAGKAMAFSTGFMLAILYYLISVAGQNLALSGSLPAWFGIWLANIIGLLGALILLQSGSQVSLFHRATKVVTSENKLTEPQKTQLKPLLSKRISPLNKATIINLINYLLLSEYAKFFFISLAILVSTSLIFTLFDLVPSIAKSGLGWWYAFGYLAYLAPQITYYVTPFAVLLGILTVFSVLVKSNQITALLASGQSTLRLALPLIAFSLLIIASLFWLSERMLPMTNQEQDFRFNRIKGRKIEQTVLALEKNWVQSLDGNIYGYQFNPTDKRLLNTYAYRLSEGTGALQSILFLAEAKFLSNDQWSSESGWTANLEQLDQSVAIQYQPLTETTKETRILIPEGNRLFTRVVNEATKMDFGQLKNYIRYLANLGTPITSLRVDLEKKLAFPFSCLPLIAIGFPLALMNSRRGTMAGIGLSIIIGFTYWITASVFESIGRQAYLPPGLSVWGPQALFFALGIVLMFRLKK